MEVGENNQLIMATHSPLIASSFEPWEVVELKFDENNQVFRELYYPIDDERHVDNYTLDPRMLTWTSILTDIFDMKEDLLKLTNRFCVPVVGACSNGISKAAAISSFNAALEYGCIRLIPVISKTR